MSKRLLQSASALLKTAVPSTTTKLLSTVKATEYLVKSHEDVKITILLPGNTDDFRLFKSIITNENIAFTSSWIDRWFGVKNLRKRCYYTTNKLELAETGDPEIMVPREIMLAYANGVSPEQITLDRFFSTPENEERLKEIYLKISEKAEKTGLGYYKFTDHADKLLGGGALAPISKEENPKMVDVALHILVPKQGIGSFCLKELLRKAFEDHGVEKVWGSSTINHNITPTLCAQHGMIIKNHDNIKYYYIDKKMWDATKDSAKIMDHPHAAAIEYEKDGNSR